MNKKQLKDKYESLVLQDNRISYVEADVGKYIIFNGRRIATSFLINWIDENKTIIEKLENFCKGK